MPDGVEIEPGLRAHRPLDLAVDLPGHARPRSQPPLDDRVRQQPPPGRATRDQAERAARSEGDRPLPPRLAGAGAARRDRRAAQGGPHPVPGGHVEPRARDRHGRGRPRDPGREPEVGGARACSASGVRGTSSAPSRRGASSPSSGPTCSSAPSSRRRCARGRSRRPPSPVIHWTCVAQQVVAICADEEIAVADLHELIRGRTRSRSSRGSSSRTCSTCSPAVIRPTSSPSSGLGSSGIASPESCVAAPALAGSP